MKEVNTIMAIKKRPEETVDSMIRRFKKEMLKSELVKELRKREFYRSPSEKRRMKDAEAMKRLNKKKPKAKMY